MYDVPVLSVTRPCVVVQILTNSHAPPGEGAKVMECMRRSLGRIRNPACAAHVTSSMVAAYRDNRMDPHLQLHCRADIDKQCMDPATALTCLRDAIGKVCAGGSAWEAATGLGHW